MEKEAILGGILGLAVGDALGVPVEFWGREELRREPVVGMRGWGTYNQPPGTWSDDTSLTLCTIEALLEAGFDPRAIAEKFLLWYREGRCTPHGTLFDIGGTTEEAILNFERGVWPPGLGGEFNQGNGSLMRILPVSLWGLRELTDRALEMVHQASAITHSHPVALIACGLYTLLVRALMDGLSRAEAYERMRAEALQAYSSPPFRDYLQPFGRILAGEVPELDEAEIDSGGYVVSTLEAALWSFLKAESFEDAVLRAVNLGGDSDTVGAVAGSLAGLFWGRGAIPSEWLEALAKAEEIEGLARKFAEALESFT